MKNQACKQKQTSHAQFRVSYFLLFMFCNVFKRAGPTKGKLCWCALKAEEAIKNFALQNIQIYFAKWKRQIQKLYQNDNTFFKLFDWVTWYWWWQVWTYNLNMHSIDIMCWRNNTYMYHLPQPNCKKNRWKISLSKATFGENISTEFSFVQSTGEHWSVKVSQL